MLLPSSCVLMDLLRQHALLAPEQLQELPRLVDGRSSDGRGLVKMLVHRGWITRYQAELLITGSTDVLTVGKYRVLDFLGEGGLSRVFMARHIENNWNVALKII